MRQLGVTRWLALVAVVAAGAFFVVGSAFSAPLPPTHGLGFTKGCIGSAQVYGPNLCGWTISNTLDTDVPQDTYVISSLTDVTHAKAGDVPSGNILSSLQLVSSGGATCNGSGSGTIADPYTGQTQCTLPGGSSASLQSDLFSYYTVKPADFTLAGHTLADDSVLTWTDTVCGATNCPVGPHTTGSGSSNQVQQNPSVTTTTIEGGSVVVAGTSVSDDVTVSAGPGTPQGALPPDGTVTFTFFSSSTCDPATKVGNSETDTLDGTGQFKGALPEGPLAPGHYGYQAVYNGSNAYTGSTGDCEPLQVVDANISLSPLSKTNEAGTSHTVTCTINQNTGSGFVAAPDGTTCSWSITAGPNSGKTGSCTTTAGSCTFTYSDTGGAGTDTIHATTTFMVAGLSLTRSTLASGTDSHGDGTDVAKTWVDANISLSPLSKTNAVGTSHTVTCTIMQNTGSGFVAAPDGTTCSWSITAGPNSPKSGTCTTTGGSCTFTYSDAGGTGTDTIHATTTFMVAGLSLTRSTLASGTDSHGDGTDVTKTWVDAQISLSPTSKTNAVGTSHTVTCTINQDKGDGNGFVAAPDGTTCSWSITAGPNSGKSGSCTTTGGSCTFTYSDTGGTGTDTIHATTTFSVGGVSLTRSTGDGLSNDGSDVTKTWVDAQISLSPLSKNNPVGTSHTVTCTIKQDKGDGAGFVAAPDGTTCSWSITAGPNSGKSGSCTTTGGSCTFTYSDTGGAGTDTIHATTTFSVGGVSLTRSTGDGLSNDSSDAKKTWLDDTVTTKVLAGSTDVTGSTTITPGTIVHDEATVNVPAGAPAPTGNVTFTLTNGTGCNGSVVSTDPNEPLNGSGVADSVTFTTPASGGPFSYLAHYSGDANYPAHDGPCEPFTVQSQTFGPALTPGFWKNHEAATTALLPITLGNYNVNTFAKALAIFNAMKCSSPIDCLAGHELAAKLDLKGGSDPSILPVIAQADALLIAVNYNGPGNFTPPTAAQKALALQLEVLIDAYTNQ